jgi:hypothetical protein
MKVKMFNHPSHFSYMIENPIEKVSIFSPKNYQILERRKACIFNHWEGKGNRLVKLSQKKL